MPNELKVEASKTSAYAKLSIHLSTTPLQHKMFTSVLYIRDYLKNGGLKG